MPRSSGDQTSQSEVIETYLQRVADTLRPFYAWEKVSDGIYLLRAEPDAQIGKKMTRELMSHGYAVESCNNGTVRVRRIGISDGVLVFDR